MAPSAPFEGDINTITDMLGIPRAQAVTLLEKYVSVEPAVNQYFEDPINSVKAQAPANQWVDADNIPYADDTTEVPGSSRPPSRADVRLADTSAGPPSSADEMQDLQRAIAMSKQTLSEQETGTIESGQQFGPANRPYYDSNQWAMTTVSSSREVVDHPPPSKRRRLSGQPAFLGGSPETGYLAPLLNIYHSIPLAREAFLLPSLRVLSYGNDPQWWSGTSDENTKSLSVETSERSSQDRHNFLAELQCLMAFLDGTNRAYGSVDALADLRAIKMSKFETHLSRLLNTWVAAAMTQSPDDQLTQIFTSIAIKASSIEGYPSEQKEIVCLEPTVHRVEGQTLTNMLDSTIWDDVADKIDDIWIEQCAEIFTVRLFDPRNDNKGLGLEIPSIWYPDRYLYDYRELTRQWRREMLALRQEISQCSFIQNRCERAQGSGRRVINIRDVLEAASNLAGPTLKESSNLPDEPSDAVAAEATTVELEEMQSKLRAILQKIEGKVKVLETRKQELQLQIKAIASQLTHPTADPTLSPRYKYILQGVSTKTNITYVRRRKKPQTLIDTTTGEESNEEFQWWRIVWGKDERALTDPTHVEPQHVASETQAVKGTESNDNLNDGQAYAVYSVDEREVLGAAKTENNSIVLVYANENAINFTPSPLSAALKKFVDQDNHVFQGEIGGESSNNRRRFSQETNTTIMEDVPLEGGNTSPDGFREMTPMSMSSPTRGADGQPSPKRAKGDEAYVYRDTDSEEEPPPYEESRSRPPAPEKKVNKIGLLADQMLDNYGGMGTDVSERDEPIHIEHAKEPLR